MHWRWRKQILVEYLCETEKWWVKYGKMTWSEGKWSGLEWSEVKWSKTKWWHWLNVCVLSLIFSNIVYVGSVHYVVSLFDAFLCYFLIRWLMFLNIPCMFVFCFVYLFYFCVFCVSVLFFIFCVLFLLLCCLFPISVQVYRPPRPAGNPIAVNKCISIISYVLPSWPVRKADNRTTFLRRLPWNLRTLASCNPEGLFRPVPLPDIMVLRTAVEMFSRHGRVYVQNYTM